MSPATETALISATINSCVVIVGFFIFHVLASRRQSRDECQQLTKDFLSTLDSYNEVVAQAWSKNGKDAVADGDIFKLRYIAI